MDLLEVEVYGSSQSGIVDPYSGRSRSIDPLAKQKRLNRTQLDIDKAAD